MSSLVGPTGAPLAPAPQTPFIDMGTPEGVTFRLPVVAVGVIQPEIIGQLVEALAPMIAQIVKDLLAGTDPLGYEVPADA